MTDPETAEATPPASAGRRSRWALAAFVLVLAGGLALLASGLGWFGDESGGEASCPSVLDYEGTRYLGHGGLERMPIAGAELGEGRRPGCDDGNGAEPTRTTRVLVLPGVDPEVAVVADSGVWLARDEVALPPVLQQATRPVRCELAGTVTVLGQWQGASGAARARFDGDLRPPYTLDLWTTDPVVVQAPWEYVVLHADVTAAADQPDPGTVRRLLQGGDPAAATLHCEGPRFVLDRISAAG